MDSTNRGGNANRGGRWSSGVAAKVARLRTLVQPSPVSGYEYVRGYGIYGLPLDSGHTLALRVFPENDFAPYKTIWHQTPEGQWSIYVDGPRHDTACHRYYDAAVDHVESATITTTWEGPMELHVEMDDPALNITLELESTWLARVMNTIGARFPVRLWRVPSVARTMARLADVVFDVGDVTLVGEAPNGHYAVLMPRQLYPIRSGSVTFEGEDLGKPVRTEINPTIGEVVLPAQPMLSIGEAYFEILDPAEYERTRAELTNTTST